MNHIIKIFTLTTLILLLNGCMGPSAGFGERMKDNFFLTSANNLSDSESRCISLPKSAIFTAGSHTYTLPAGTYTAKKKNNAGYFYYAPSSISATNSFFAPRQEGIYLDNQGSSGNLFARNEMGYDDRPIRNVTLPNSILSAIKMNSGC